MRGPLSDMYTRNHDGRHRDWFQALSPDELALVTTAQDMAFVIQNRGYDTITIVLLSITMNGIRHETYEVRSMIEFQSYETDLYRRDIR